MSVINKNKAQGYASWHRPEDFARMRQWGMNCIRLGVLWDGLEPEPGKFDEAYLKQIDERIRWAREQGLYVFLDMHQDLYSVLFSDGAPAWATLTEGHPHPKESGVWSDAYFTSPAVQTAFDHFWANSPGPDGVGLQDHFARAWRCLAERYAHEPAVIGYDLFNEPNMGSKSPLAQMVMVSQFARLLQEKKVEGAPDALSIVEQWGTPAGRSSLMAHLEDMSIYVPIQDAVAEIYNEFERTQLMPMYQRVANAIREVDSRHIIFLETSMASNMGVRSAIEPVNGRDGQRDAFQAYAPHGYDIVVDTPDQVRASLDRIALIFTRHAETARRLQMPMLVGEWGAYGGAKADILPAARAVVRQFEQHLCGETYWEYGKYVLDCAYREILDRPIPLHTAGTLLSYQSDPETKAFSCAWKEDAAVTAPTSVYLPEGYYRPSNPPQLDPAGPACQVEPSGSDTPSVFLVIPPLGQPINRRLSIAR
jgi:endoglycosylceramidase